MNNCFSAQDEKWMQEAFKLAQRAALLNEVPVGAIVVCNNKIIGRGFNKRESEQNPLAHAEIIAIKKAASYLKNWRLLDCTLYVTLEPCAMCAGAIVNARIKNLVFGSKDPKAGAVCSLMKICTDKRLNHQVNVKNGLLEQESSLLLKKFFKKIRA